ncbi:hypothetical protein P691DRAFT_807554 [Macrolepiota fuliginosa MF-IS2]|uniref:Uncharacterized protein n=1 Tax=Macrolepiota fuliginosa MF-IS2 TaxID=1400762 RepID=A0A9P5X4G4_9AGAR|nr:hypothetical protein P691DRAFT_807554 [Macrolepiota fuliginosa MF-IS2]
MRFSIPSLVVVGVYFITAAEAGVAAPTFPTTATALIPRAEATPAEVAAPTFLTSVTALTPRAEATP